MKLENKNDPDTMGARCKYIKRKGQRCKKYTLSSTGFCHIHRERGYFSTKQWAVDLVLNLAEYSIHSPIEKYTFLDPGCGDGIFIITAIDRFINRARKIGIDNDRCLSFIKYKFVGIDSHPPTVKKARNQIKKFFENKLELSSTDASSIAGNIIICGDFLSIKHKIKFDFIIGNPPYIRYDDIDKKVLEEIKVNYRTFMGRSDLYIPFIEQSLSSLSRIGKLGFICTNRFAFSDYGKGIRNEIINNYSVTNILDLEGIKPFNKNVDVYPWIIIVSRNKHNDNIKYGWISNANRISNVEDVTIEWHIMNLKNFTDLNWKLLRPTDLKLWKKFATADFIKLDNPQLGFTIHVGVATGADQVFINPSFDDGIEKELLFPVIMSSTADGNRVIKSDDWILNTWRMDVSGSLIDLDQWPKTEKYLLINKKRIESRYIAKKYPEKWYRLIDKITPELINCEKLLIPSLRKNLEIYYDPGGHVPHHNFYYIAKESNTKRQYSLKLLGAILSSTSIRQFASLISIPFKSRTKRFMKSQILQLPIPHLDNVIEYKNDLEIAFLDNDIETIDEIMPKILMH